MKEIARLRELLAEATRAKENLAAIEADPERRGRFVHHKADDTESSARYDLAKASQAALPALLDRLEAAEAVVEAAREADRRRQDHGRDAAAETALHDALRRYDEVRRG